MIDPWITDEPYCCDISIPECNINNDDPFEVIRLRRLLENSILKVEKENLELIQKEKKRVPCQNNTSKSRDINAAQNGQKSSSSLKELPAAQNRPKSVGKSFILDSVKKNSSVYSSSLQDDHAEFIMDGDPNYSRSRIQQSNVTFLNRFSSSLLLNSMKKRVLQAESKAVYTPCAVPLALPDTKKNPVFRKGKEANSSKNLENYTNNNAVYHFTSMQYPEKKLTFQTLPSISIDGKANFSAKSFETSDFRFTEQKDFSCGSGMRTRFLPMSAENNCVPQSSSSNQQLLSVHCNKSQQTLYPECLKQSVHTQTDIKELRESEEVDKNMIQNLIEEILQTMQFQSNLLECSSDKIKRKAGIIETERESISFEMLDKSVSVNCSSPTFIKENSLHIERKSMCTQTENDKYGIQEDKERLKILIKEVLQDLKSKYGSDSLPELKEVTVFNKIHTEIQTEEKLTAASIIIDNASKATQVHLLETDSDKHVYSNQTKEKQNEGFTERSGDVAPEPVGNLNKLESILKEIHQHICENTNLASNSGVGSSSSTLPVQTRDVALQINPPLTSTKSTLTTESSTVDSANQCVIPVYTTEKKIGTEITLMPLEVHLENKQKVDSSTNCEPEEHVFLKESSSQTVGPLPVFTYSENSTTTSVSSTPVSDSMFMDDMLSEGELILPWNLRLLPFIDKGNSHNSTNATEASDMSSKDYSISEGEIPPKYVCLLNAEQPSSAQSSKVKNKSANLTPRFRPEDSQMTDNLPADRDVEVQTKKCTSTSHSTETVSEGELSYDVSLSEGEIPPSRLAFLFSPTSTQDSMTPSNDTSFHKLSSEKDKSMSKSTSLSLPGKGKQLITHHLHETGISEDVEQSNIHQSSTSNTLDMVNEETRFYDT